MSSGPEYAARLRVQQRRIDELELMAFWFRNSRESFKKAMVRYNWSFSLCACHVCQASGRATDDDAAFGNFDIPEDGSCLFAQTFEQELASRGFVVEVVAQLPDNDSPDPPGTGSDFVLLSFGRPHMWIDDWHFGARIMGAKMARDEALVRYEALLDYLLDRSSVEQQIYETRHRDWSSRPLLDWPHAPSLTMDNDAGSR